MRSGQTTPGEVTDIILPVWLQSTPIIELNRRHDRFVKNRKVEMGFNLFHLIANVYHQENLHSDIMEAIISPSGNHGDRLLHLFLDFLRRHQHMA
jgi:hypothetical protein